MSHPPTSTTPETATPEAGTPTTPAPVDPVISVVVAATRDLNDAAAAQLLHWCEARLHLLDAGQSGISHLMLDLSRARRATTSAVAILDHARDEAMRRHVGIHLVGAAPIMATCALPVRHRLGRWSAYPTLDAALAALDPPAGADRASRRPVDPDALVLTPITPQDRLG